MIFARKKAEMTDASRALPGRSQRHCHGQPLIS